MSNQIDEDVVTPQQSPPQQTITPLPKLIMFVVSVLMFSEAFGTTSLFPMLPFMVKDFGLTNDEKLVGRYAGFIASSFPLAMSMTAYNNISKSLKHVEYFGGT
jgi:MFS family permease